MSRLVKEGRLVWPPQVETELTEYGGDPDRPAKWVLDNVTGKRSPAFESIRRVMAEAGEVVDQKKEKEDADPYVLGLGVELQAADSRVLVVTNDFRDKRGRISMVTACERLELPTMRFKSFLRIAATTE
jgi:hypothetical protein